MVRVLRSTSVDRRDRNCEPSRPQLWTRRIAIVNRNKEYIKYT